MAKAAGASKRTAQRARQEATEEGKVAPKQMALDKAKAAVKAKPKASKEEQAKAAGVGSRTIDRAHREASVPSGASASNGADQAPEILKLRRLKLSRQELLALTLPICCACAAT